MRLQSALARAAALVVVVGFSVFAQTEVLFLGGIQLKLGMPEGDVLSKLREQYHLLPMEKNGFLLMDKAFNKPLSDRPYTPDLRTHGSVYFHDGKLAKASKSWGNFDSREAAAPIESLFSVLANLNDEGRSAASVTTAVIRSPDNKFQQIQIRFGIKSVTIMVSTGRWPGVEQERVVVQVDEGIWDRPVRQ